jgi:hypothetical protein
MVLHKSIILETPFSERYHKNFYPKEVPAYSIIKIIAILERPLAKKVEGKPVRIVREVISKMKIACAGGIKHATTSDPGC